MERLTPAQSVMKATKARGTVAKSASNALYYKLQKLLKPVVRPWSHVKSEIEPTLADVAVARETEVEAVFENCLTKWTNPLKSRIFKAAESTLEDTLQASY